MGLGYLSHTFFGTSSGIEHSEGLDVSQVRMESSRFRMLVVGCCPCLAALSEEQLQLSLPILWTVFGILGPGNQTGDNREPGQSSNPQPADGSSF